MDTVFLIIDESGAKGYSDKEESYDGEIGVIAGYLIPASYLDLVKINFESIKSKYLTDAKVHVTDLNTQEQSSIRQEIYSFIIETNIICVYEAIHTQGFYENYDRLASLIENNKRNLRSSVKVSSRKNKELLHEHLFQGVFGKALAFCIDQFGEEFELKVITDRVDESIKKRFIESAEELINVGKEHETKVTGFDTSTKKVVEGSIVSRIDNAQEVIGDFSKIKYSIDYEDSGLTLAADVIVNGLNHHFKSRSALDVGLNLNDRVAVNSHPLKNIIYGLWDSTESNYFSDAVFMHPKNSVK
jgi:hypothetical protein